MVIIEIKNSLLSFSSFIAFEFDFQRRHPSMSLSKSIRSHPSIHSSNADCCVAVHQSSSMMDHGLKACLSVSTLQCRIDFVHFCLVGNANTNCHHHFRSAVTATTVTKANHIYKIINHYC